MHPENKLTNHGKAGNGGAQPQHQNVNQGPTCNLGSKGVGAGTHGAKATQISPSNSSLKNTQAGGPPFSSLKGKVKRERSVSVDSGEQREAGTPSLDSEAKGTPFSDPQKPSMFYSKAHTCSQPIFLFPSQSSSPASLQHVCGGTFLLPPLHPPTGSFLRTESGQGGGLSSLGATHDGATQWWGSQSVSSSLAVPPEPLGEEEGARCGGADPYPPGASWFWAGGSC